MRFLVFLSLLLAGCSDDKKENLMSDCILSNKVGNYQSVYECWPLANVACYVSDSGGISCIKFDTPYKPGTNNAKRRIVEIKR